MTYLTSPNATCNMQLPAIADGAVDHSKEARLSVEADP